MAASGFSVWILFARGCEARSKSPVSEGVVLEICFHNEHQATFPSMLDGELAPYASRGFHNK